MRKRATREWGGVSLGVATIAALGVASLTGVSLAAKGQKSSERLASQKWVISINHETKLLPQKDELIYCKSAVLESMEPRLVIKASGTGHHYYAYHVVNPKGERSQNIYAGFNGTSTTTENAFVPDNWSRAQEKETNPLFQPGTYTLEVALGAEIIH